MTGFRITVAFLTLSATAAIASTRSTSKIVRTQLTAAEMVETIDFSVSLKMRNMDELHAILQKGERVSQAEMEAKYLPLQSDYDEVKAWLLSQGLSEAQLVDSNHTNIFVRGAVATIAQTLGVQFARIATVQVNGKPVEVTSAISEPTFPARFQSRLIAAGGLNRDQKLRQNSVTTLTLGDSAGLANSTYIPAALNVVYHNTSGLTGTGQTIAVVMDGRLDLADLASFISHFAPTANIANYTNVPVNGGASQTAPIDMETTSDVETVMGMAPGAKVRLYNSPQSGAAAKYNAILNDHKSDPSITVTTESAAGPEGDYPDLEQIYAQLTAAGVTLCCSSGDAGSNTMYTQGPSGVYRPTAPLAALYPGTSPYFTSVGGTQISQYQYPTSTSWVETTWVQGGFSGGGISKVIARPVWQTGPGVPEGNTRCEPDVSVMAGPISGWANGHSLGFGGTSASSPIFAAYVAILNQARAAKGLPSLGLLGPKIYPLIGTSAFNDITINVPADNGVGDTVIGNGAYVATKGYDLVTGIGTPNIDNLITVLTGGATPVGVSSDENDKVVVASGNAIHLSVTPSSNVQTIRWQVSSGSSWNDLSDGTDPRLAGASASGAGSSSLTINNPGVAIDGLQFRCYVTSGAGASDSTAGTTASSRPITVRVMNAVSSWSQPFQGGASVGITKTFASRTMVAGAPFTLAVNAQDSANQGVIHYQWERDGAAILGATNESYTPQTVAGITGAAGVPDSGRYTLRVFINYIDDANDVQAFIDFGSVTVTENSWLTNISARASVGTDSNVLIAGFVTNGPGDKAILVRAAGPTLGLPPFNITGALPAAKLDFYSGQTLLGSFTDWTKPANLAAITSDVGGFPLQRPNDAATIQTLSSKAYTAVVSGPSGTGVGIVELYDADAASNKENGTQLSGPPTNHLVNISARSNVGTGDNVLIAGFVIAGTTSKTVLIRAVGPTIALAPFNISTAVAQPTLTLYDDHSTTIAAVQSWDFTAPGTNGSVEPVYSNDPMATHPLFSLGTSRVLNGTIGLRRAVADDYARTGAFPFTQGSWDSAIVATLPPGLYSAIVSGAGSSTGVALVEVYELH